jgi:prolyl-tRNA synthetase
MTHGDDRGLVLPPDVAPIQAVIIPIAQHKEGVLDRCYALKEELAQAGIRVKLDDSDASAGWKFSEYEMKGVPLRIELGPRDIEAGNCVIVSRSTGEKTVVSLDNIGETVKEALVKAHDDMFNKALENREKHTYEAESIEEINKVLEEKGDGFVFAPWCGDEACEDEVKAQAGIGSRCIFDGVSYEGKKCVCCGKEAKFGVVWAKAY